MAVYEAANFKCEINNTVFANFVARFPQNSPLNLQNITVTLLVQKIGVGLRFSGPFQVNRQGQQLTFQLTYLVEAPNDKPIVDIHLSVNGIKTAQPAGQVLQSLNVILGYDLGATGTNDTSDNLVANLVTKVSVDSKGAEATFAAAKKIRVFETTGMVLTGTIGNKFESFDHIFSPK